MTRGEGAWVTVPDHVIYKLRIRSETGRVHDQTIEQRFLNYSHYRCFRNDDIDLV